MPKLRRKIVAFLQNQWFKDPHGVKEAIRQTTEREKVRDGRTAEEVREFYIRTFLFWGCLTGKRLRTSLGEELCDEIVWEEVSREIGGRSASSFPADLEHVKDVLRRHTPTHVLAYGKIASEALASLPFGLGSRFILITAPHPAARDGNTLTKLREVRRKLDE